MNKNRIQELYRKKIKLIKKLNKFYFDKSAPIVTDKSMTILKWKFYF